MRKCKLTLEIEDKKFRVYTNPSNARRLMKTGKCYFACAKLRGYGSRTFKSKESKDHYINAIWSVFFGTDEFAVVEI